MDDKNLNIIKKQAQTFLPESKVILFGSRARNTQTENSDYDILIITNKIVSMNEKRNYKRKIRNALHNFDILSDILVQDYQEIEMKKKLPGHIIKNAIKEGVLL